MIVRPAAQTDTGAIASLWHDGWRAGHLEHVPEELVALRTAESFAERTATHLAAIRILSDDTGLIGFHLCKGDELNQFYLAARARGSGAAEILMRDAEATLRTHGHRLCWLACAMGNVRARRFYEKAGWRLARTEAVALETLGNLYPLSVWRMEKDLVAGPT